MEEEIRYNILDDRHEIYNMYISQCAQCLFFEHDEYKCKAFPDGIPEDLLSGNQKHENILKNQVGETIFKKEH